LVEGRRVLLKRVDRDKADKAKKAREVKRERKTNYELIAVYDRLPVVVNSGLHSKLAEKLVKPIFGCEILKKSLDTVKAELIFSLVAITGKVSEVQESRCWKLRVAPS